MNKCIHLYVCIYGLMNASMHAYVHYISKIKYFGVSVCLPNIRSVYCVCLFYPFIHSSLCPSICCCCLVLSLWQFHWVFLSFYLRIFFYFFFFFVRFCQVRLFIYCRHQVFFLSINFCLTELSVWKRLPTHILLLGFNYFKHNYCVLHINNRNRVSFYFSVFLHYSCSVFASFLYSYHGTLLYLPC